MRSTVEHCSYLPVRLTICFQVQKPWLPLFTLESCLWGHNPSICSMNYLEPHTENEIFLWENWKLSQKDWLCAFSLHPLPHPFTSFLQALQLPASVRIQWVEDRLLMWASPIPLFCTVVHLRLLLDSCRKIIRHLISCQFFVAFSVGYSQILQGAQKAGREHCVHASCLLC